MNKITIICIDDQREVLNAICRDLKPFEAQIDIEECESAREALDLMDEIDSRGDFIAVLISDHVMPDMSGVEFLTEVRADQRFDSTRKVLLTGLATHQDTITAINQAGIDNYIEKPWQKDDLLRIVRQLLTHYLIDKGLDYQPYIAILDQEVLLGALKSIQ